MEKKYVLIVNEIQIAEGSNDTIWAIVDAFFKLNQASADLIFTSILVKQMKEEVNE